MQDAEAKYERCYIRRVVVLVIGSIVLGAGLLGFCSQANADPLYRAEAGDAVITVYTEPCAVKAVGNLPKRATWTEKGKTFEGCAGSHPQYPILVFYFEGDKSVVVIEHGAFQKVTGT